MTALFGDALTGIAATIPAPPGRELDLGPFTLRFYALCLLAGIGVATWITYRRWTREGGDPDLVLEVALWGSIAGIIGGRIYHVITSWDTLGPEWWAPFAIWKGGLGIWGAIALGVAVGALVVRSAGASIPRFMDAAAPGIVLGQGIGRLGNWFNQELFGGPSSLPWALEVEPRYRPAEYLNEATFHPTFAYEGLWNVAVAGVLVLLSVRLGEKLRPAALFCLYVVLYTVGRVWWELLRVDHSHQILGQRLNFWIAIIVGLGALVAFVIIQRRPRQEPPSVTATASR